MTNPQLVEKNLTVRLHRLTRVGLTVALTALASLLSALSGWSLATTNPPHAAVWPAAGPVGTLIHYRIRASSDLFDTWELRKPDKRILRGLYTDVPDCEILPDTSDDHLGFDAANRVISGMMRIGATGRCNPTAGGPRRAHAVVPGTYNLTLGCLSCVVGHFTVTSSALPFTGSSLPIWPAVVAGIALLAVGAISVRAGTCWPARGRF